jgi:hypothetical protein
VSRREGRSVCITGATVGLAVIARGVAFFLGLSRR